jgi:two-component system sensor histidine kinase ChiS
MLNGNAVKGWSIICVDDEEIVLNSLRRQLRKIAKGYRIEVATSGNQALQTIEHLNDRSRPVALVITDQVMPMMNGDDLLVKIKDLSPNTYQVMLTGQADGESVGRALNEGKLFRFMAKPWSETDLHLTVQTALDAFHRDLDLQEKTQRLHRAHQRSLAFVPHHYLRTLGKEHFEDVERGDAVARKVAMMFTDIRGFTSLIEEMTPELSFQFVNHYYKTTEPSIYNHNGFVDHYFGDGVMAIFPEGAVNGLKAAIDFLKRVDSFNHSLLDQNQDPIQVGIGLHIGDVIMGVCGGEQSIQCTVIGDCVNLTARLEGLSSRYQTRLIISNDLHQEAQHHVKYQVRELEYVRVKGRTQPTQVYEVLDVLPVHKQEMRLKTKALFQKGVQYMQHQQFVEGKEIFEHIIHLDPLDAVAILHLKTCTSLLEGEALIDHQGASMIREK